MAKFLWKSRLFMRPAFLLCGFIFCACGFKGVWMAGTEISGGLVCGIKRKESRETDFLSFLLSYG